MNNNKLYVTSISFVFITITLPVTIGYLFHFKERVVSFFYNDIFTLSISIIVFASLFVIAQFFTGAIYNGLKNNEQHVSNKKMSTHFIIRLLILTYSIYEILAFYSLNLILYGILPSIVIPIQTTRLNIELIKFIIIVLLCTLFIGFLIKYFILNKLLRKWINLWRIDKNSTGGSLVSDIQQQIANLTFIILSVTTLASIFGVSPTKEETSVLFAITTFATSNYTFMIAKSKFIDSEITEH